MRINNNIAALNTYNRLSMNETNANKSLEKLSSGLRINKAGDDAAGLAISEKMRGQIRGLNQAQRNAQDGISLIQTAEGALNESHSILQRMRELAVQAASDTLQSTDRTAITTEMNQLIDEVDRIATKTQFNGTTLLTGSFGLARNVGTPGSLVSANVTGLDLSGAKVGTTYALTSASAATTVALSDGAGNTQTISGLTNITSWTGTLNFDKLGIKISLNNSDLSTDLNTKTIITAASGSVNVQIGANGAETLALSIDDMSKASTGLNVTGVSVSTSANATTAISTIDTAIDKVSTQRAKLGAWQNRLEHTINNLSTASENLTASESRVRDVDMASEMMAFTKNNILQQAATAMLAQANQAPQGVLQLLR